MISADEFNSRVAFLMERPLLSGYFLDLTFPPGWLDLIGRTVTALEALPGGASLRCCQIKVKWGQLRFHLYLKAGTEPDVMNRPANNPWAMVRPDGELGQRAEILVLQAEDESVALCYLCGKSASMLSQGRVLPLCGDHETADIEEMLAGYHTFKLGAPYARF